MTAPLSEIPRRRHHEREPGIGDQHDARADEVEAEPQTKVHQGMELPPAVIVGVEEEGLGEEEQHVWEEGGGEHAHQVVRELRIQNDEHEREERAEGRGEREGDGEELRELVREPVVSQISRLVADRLDDQREDRDGKDERREQQVELRNRPDGHAASDDWEGSGTRPRRTALPEPSLPRLLSRRPVPARAASGRRSRKEPGKAPCTRDSSGTWRSARRRRTSPDR